MKECIFNVYYENDKYCDRNYKCDNCEVKKAIKKQIEIWLKKT